MATEYRIVARATGPLSFFGQTFHAGDPVRVQLGYTTPELVARIAAALTDCTLLTDVEISGRQIPDWTVVSTLTPRPSGPQPPPLPPGDDPDA